MGVAANAQVEVGQAHTTLVPRTCFVWRAKEAHLQEEPGRYPIGLSTTKGTILNSLVVQRPPYQRSARLQVDVLVAEKARRLGTVN